MAEETRTGRGELLQLTGDIVAAHVTSNAVAHQDLAGFIGAVFAKLSELASDEAASRADLTPAVPVKKSVTDDYIICLEDGKKLKMLKRYLMTNYGMTPEEYRAKWGLRPDYPMVAPNYAAKRQELARKIGLGRKRKEPVSAVAAEKPQAKAPARSRARRKAA